MSGVSVIETLGCRSTCVCVCVCVCELCMCMCVCVGSYQQVLPASRDVCLCEHGRCRFFVQRRFGGKSRLWSSGRMLRCHRSDPGWILSKRTHTSRSCRFALHSLRASCMPLCRHDTRRISRQMDADQYPRRVFIGSHWSLNCGYLSLSHIESQKWSYSMCACVW